ncbi:hypothetical protein N7507_000548 [Penicillium longicatenatum]|nr:hypothetical protein N7507_000548 [Penicillium longicatenatum]
MAQVNCGCCVYIGNILQYLPQVSLKAHATIFSTAARTMLTQTFVNPSNCILEEASYRFPLYDGVSVVGFKCHVGTRLLHSKVKSKEQANTDYQNAVDRNESAAIMDQSYTESDVFTIRLGNVPASEKVTVEITFIGELKQDAQVDGIRYTLPNSIAPRYQNVMTMPTSEQASGFPAQLEGISITADIQLEKTSVIRELQSPSHSPRVSLARVSSTAPDARGFEPSQASATLHLDNKCQALLARDFVLVAKADGLDNPRALLESHSTIPGQRALMATLVPKFSLPSSKPEIVFVIDRSASMEDNISTLKNALQVFLKSLPLGVCFNICSFGTGYSFLWPGSKAYDKSSLQEALSLVDSIGADMGGTNMQPAVEATLQNRLPGKDLEVLLLTDGAIMDQDSLFQIVRETSNRHNARFFTLGIGHAASHALIEGVARAGQGFSQSVLQNEELDKSIVRMLKGALTPHIYDYKLEVDYDNTVDQDYELVNPVSPSPTEVTVTSGADEPAAPPISLFSDDFKEPESISDLEGAFADTLPVFSSPKVIQAPHKIPPLYPFIRTTAYLLLDPESDRIPRSLIFTATSQQGPLCLRIPITDIGKGETIHQLASRKAVVELEERHGWLENMKDASGNPFNQLHSQTQKEIVARECQNLGIKYQITGKYCSFVALENDSDLAKGSGNQEPKEYKAGTMRVPVASRWSGFGHATMMCAQGTPLPDEEFEDEEFESSTSTSTGPSSGGLFGNTRSTPASSIPPPPPGRMQTQHAQMAVSSGTTFGQASTYSAPIGYYARNSPRAPATGRGMFGQTTASADFSSGGLFGSVQHPPPPPPTQQKPHKKTSRFGRGEAPTSGSPNEPSFSQPASSPTAAGLFGNAQTSAPEPPRSKVHSLIALQTFEGSWVWNQQFFDVMEDGMNETCDKVTALLQTFGKQDPFTDREENVVATMLAMEKLKRDHQNSEDLWELVFQKAQTWVSNELAEMQSPVFGDIANWVSRI